MEDLNSFVKAFYHPNRTDFDPRLKKVGRTTLASVLGILDRAMPRIPINKDQMDVITEALRYIAVRGYEIGEEEKLSKTEK
ncbi:MAG: hypothetical protein Q8N88_02975 [Nanoarchaeota archaeon]|nr:hypothetical protein [Nanoarchaeota archaeon]